MLCRSGVSQRHQRIVLYGSLHNSCSWFDDIGVSYLRRLLRLPVDFLPLLRLLTTRLPSGITFVPRKQSLLFAMAEVDSRVGLGLAVVLFAVRRPSRCESSTSSKRSCECDGFGLDSDVRVDSTSGSLAGICIMTPESESVRVPPRGTCCSLPVLRRLVRTFCRPSESSDELADDLLGIAHLDSFISFFFSIARVYPLDSYVAPQTFVIRGHFNCELFETSPPTCRKRKSTKQGHPAKCHHSMALAAVMLW